MKIDKELYVVAKFTEKNTLFIWKSKLFGTIQEAKVIKVNLADAKIWKVYKCRLSFPDLKEQT